MQLPQWQNQLSMWWISLKNNSNNNNHSPLPLGHYRAFLQPPWPHPMARAGPFVHVHHPQHPCQQPQQIQMVQIITIGTSNPFSTVTVYYPAPFTLHFNTHNHLVYHPIPFWHSISQTPPTPPPAPPPTPPPHPPLPNSHNPLPKPDQWVKRARSSPPVVN